MAFRVALIAFVAVALAACGQVESGANLDTTPIGATASTPATLPSETVAPSSTVAPVATPTRLATALPGLQPTFTSAPATQSDANSEAVTRTRAALAAALGVAPQSLALVRVEDQEWSDSSLGCPSPDQAYMQVIIAGQRIVFSNGSTTYAVHTDGRGSRMIWCNGGKPVKLK